MFATLLILLQAESLLDNKQQNKLTEGPENKLTNTLDSTTT